jgi:hypothetical protein
MEFSPSAGDEKGDDGDDDVEPEAEVLLSIDDVVPLLVTAFDEAVEGVKDAILRVPFDVKDLISVLRSKSSKNHLNVTLRGSESTSQVT